MILELPKVTDSRGNLSFLEAGRHVPFDIRRIFYLYGAPTGQMRAGHALKKCEQVLIAMSGSFDVVVDDGNRRDRFNLDRPDCGLCVPALAWREIDNFSSDSVCLVIASEFYAERDYLDEYPEFTRVVGAHKK